MSGARADTGWAVRGTPELLKDFGQVLEERFPGIQVACRIAPPFRPLTPEEDEEFTHKIVDSGARILLVGIDCPKQEKWIASHQGRVPAVMLGVGRDASLEDLVPKDNFYRRLEATLDLSFVRDLVKVVMLLPAVRAWTRGSSLVCSS